MLHIGQVMAQMRVSGVERLRVMNASTMPDFIGGNIDQPVMMMGEGWSSTARRRSGHGTLS